MREGNNINDVAALGVDIIGMIFWARSPRYVSMRPVGAGIIPDMAYSDQKTSNEGVKKCGIFVDEMPQNIITRIYNYDLDYIQLHGNESPTMIRNLRKSLVPDIVPDIKIIKALSIREKDDVKRWRLYDGIVDYLLFDTKCVSVGGSGTQFDWDVLQEYDGNIPFFLSGGIGPEDVENVRSFSHPKCVGIDLNSKFEVEPGLKNVDMIRTFLNELKQ